jgi:hypothetical protein
MELHATISLAGAAGRNTSDLAGRPLLARALVWSFLRQRRWQQAVAMPSTRRLPSCRILGVPLRVASLLSLGTALVNAQEALRTSLAGQEAAEARRRQMENRPYNIKKGDFRLLATPSIGLDWNDNPNLSGATSGSDFMLRPKLDLAASYPLTAHNLLSVNLGVGYDHYFKNDDLSGFRLSSGSAIAFDIFVKDFRIDFHDRFSYSLDAAGRSDIAGTGLFGGFDNTVGVTGDWDLRDLILTLGYDHQDFIASNQQFQSNDRSSEHLVSRAGLKLRPDLITGVEGTASWTSYKTDLLNDSVGYSAGVYGNWSPSSTLSIQPRGGYSLYSFDQTSRYLPAVDQDSWYIGLTLSHRPREAVDYSLSAGHELRLGAQSDMTEVTYFRPSVTWRILRDLTLRTSVFYEHGQQSLGGPSQALAQEEFDWYGGSLSLGYPLMKRLQASLNYRLTFRSSNLESPNRDYTQNVLGLLLTYRLP